MGVATGKLKAGVAPAASAVLELAKLVSDAGAGGQILMCRETFFAIKDMTAELGTITDKGEEAGPVDRSVASSAQGLSLLSCMG